MIVPPELLDKTKLVKGYQPSTSFQKGLWTSLQSLPTFRALSVQDQIAVTQKIMEAALPYYEPFQRMTTEERIRFVKSQLILAPIVDSLDPDNDTRLKGLALDTLDNKPEAATYLGIARTSILGTSNSGLVQLGITLADKINNGLRALNINTGLHKDGLKQSFIRQRDYLNALEAIMSRDIGSEFIGNLLGTVVDVAAVNTVMAPVTGAAKTGIDALSRGMTTTAMKTAVASGTRLPPVIHPLIAKLAPIAAESTIEAVPYYILTEAKNYGNDYPLTISKGAGAVLKTIGLNAAQDFLFGTLAYGAFRTGGKLFNAIFKRAPATDTIQTLLKKGAITQTDFDAMVDNVRKGSTSPEFWTMAQDVDYAWHETNQLHYAGLKDGSLVDFADNPLASTANIAIRTSTPFRKITNGTETLFEVFDPDYHTGNFRKLTFRNYNELENFYSTKLYHNLKDSPDILDNIRKDNPTIEYYYNRGEALAQKQSLLADVQAPHVTLKTTIAERPIILDAEANSLVAASQTTKTFTAIKAQAPLDSAILTRIKETGSNAPLPASALTRVVSSPDGNALYVGLKPAPQDVYADALATAQQRAAQLGLSVDDYKRSILLNKGYDHIQLPDGSYEFFDNSAIRLIGSADDVALVSRKSFDLSSSATQYAITETATTTRSLKSLAQDPKLTAKAFYTAVNSNNPEALLSLLTRAYTPKGMNVIVEAASDITAVQAKAAGETLTVSIPTIKPTTLEKQHELFVSYFEALNQALPQTKLFNPDFLAKLAKVELPDPLAFTLKPNYELIESLATKANIPLIRTPQGVIIQHAGRELAFTDLNDAFSYLAPRTLDFSTIKADLARQGISLTRKGDIYTATSTINHTRIASGALDDVITAIGYRPSYLDLAHAPRITSINPDGTFTLTTSKTKIVKSQAEAMQYLDKFKDTRTLANMEELHTSKHGSISQTPDKLYYVYNTRLKAGEYFTSPGEARRWLETEKYSFDEYRRIADKKGLTIHQSPQGYVVYASDAQYTARTHDDLVTIFSKYPDIEHSVPDMLDELDPSLNPSIHDIAMTYAKDRPKKVGANVYDLPPEIPGEMTLSPWMSMRLATSQTENLILDLSQRLKVPKLQEYYYSVIHGYKRAIVESSEAINATRVALSAPDGKLLSRESRARIYYYLAANSPQEYESLLKQGVAKFGDSILEPLTEVERTAAERLRTLYNTLSERFHIDAHKLVFNYMPRLRDWYNNPANKHLLNDLLMADDLVNRSGVELPQNIRTWFEHERVQDIAEYWVIDDPLELTTRYINAGFKKLHMGESWKALSLYAKASNLPPAVITRLEFLRAQLMGTYRMPDVEKLAAMGEGFMTRLYDSKLGTVLKQKYTREDVARIGRTLYKSAYGLTYFGTLGWKPFVAIRNSIDALFVQGVPRLGLNYITEAIDEVHKGGEAFFHELQQKGVIFERAPILDDLLDLQLVPEKVTNSAFRWLSNSDDLNRAVIYKAAINRFRDAIELKRIGKLSARRSFEGWTGIDLLDKNVADWFDTEINKALSDTNRLRSLEHEYGLRMISATQEDFASANSPALFRTTFVGRLFGQFGNFSAGYRARLAKLITGNNASWGRRIAALSSMLVVSAATWGTFTALNIRTNDFTPLTPGIFTGGACFWLCMDILKAATPGEPMRPYYLKRSAETLKSLTVPGYFYLKKALKYAEEGNTYATLLALMGASYNDKPTQ